MRLLILGCGLLGASVAMAAKHRGVAQTITGLDPNPASVVAARALGVFDSVEDSASAMPTLPNADIGIAAGPPSSLAASVAQLAPVCGLVLDVGSVKAPVLQALVAQADGVPSNYVPCHPMAGSEQAGAGAAQAALFVDRQVFVTTTDDNTAAMRAQAHGFWQALGAQTTELSPSAHDAAVAYTSHLPHLLASAYVGMDAPIPAAAGPGYRDFSRLAKANPVLWADILRTNRTHIVPLIKQLKTALDEAQSVLESSSAVETPGPPIRDTLVDYLTLRKQAREQLDEGNAREDDA